MKIGFDGKRATNNLTGLGNYSRSLIAHLAEFFPQNQYFVYTPKINYNAQIRHFLNKPNIKACLPDQKSWLWRTLGIKTQLAKDNISLFHGLSHEIPVGIRQSGIPSIVTIHDLIFLKFPKYFGRIDRYIYTIKCRYACKHANKIVAISECTKRDIISYFGTPADKIAVVYQSCDESFKLPANEETKMTIQDMYGLPAKYILNVGTIEPRKNLLTLIKALKHIDQDYKLIVVGRKTAYTDLVNKEIDLLDLKSRVVFLQDVPFQDLPVIYQMATTFVYPSLYEGFGIPIIEALYSGIPVVAATGSCLEEAGGHDSVYVAPLDHMAMAAAINKVLSDISLQEQMKTKGLSYVQKFNNESISNEMMTVYTKVLSTDHN